MRQYDAQGGHHKDIIALRDETLPGAEPLLAKVMGGGRCVRAHPSLGAIRNYFNQNFAALPAKYKTNRATEVYPVVLSRRVETLQTKIDV